MLLFLVDGVLDQGLNTEAGGALGSVAAGSVVHRRTSEVNVAPADASLDVLLEEGSGAGSTTVTTLAGGAEVGLVALHLVDVLGEDGEAPETLVVGLASGGQLASEAGAVGEETSSVLTESDNASTSQGGKVDNVGRLVLVLDEGESISKGKTALSISVTDLNRALVSVNNGVGLV